MAAPKGEIQLSTIKLNEDNPRFINDQKFVKLVQSLRSFPEMMSIRPIVVDENLIALGGNMRLRALQEIGHETIPQEWVKQVSGLSDEQKREFIIKDNISFGQWDYDALANSWDQDKLTEWGMDLPVLKETKDASDKIKEVFCIEITCDSEEDQEQAYNKLIEQGYKCRILTF